MTKKEYLLKVENASNSIRKGFILLGKDLQKYTRIGIDLKGNTTLYNHWLGIDLKLTPGEFSFIEKHLPKNIGYNRFAK